MTEAEARAMTDQPAAEMERDPKADDQMVALALAKLAIERPGWLWTLRGLGKARGFLDHFEAFREIHADTAVLATAAERDRLLKVNEGLVKALEFFFKALDEEWLIRNIEKDNEPDWVIKSMPWVQGFAKAMNALDEARKS